MNEIIPIAVFIACMLATIGLVRVCEWLRPRSTGPGLGDHDRVHEEGRR